jgi:hypothetical protein
MGRLCGFQADRDENGSDIWTASMQDGRNARLQDRQMEGKKASIQSGTNACFHGEKPPKHRLGKMSDESE